AAALPVGGLVGVEAALEAGAGLGGGEAERGRSIVRRPRGAGVDRRLRRGGVDGERAGGRARVGVADRVGRPDLERMRAVLEGAVGLRRAAGLPVGGLVGVEAALEAGAGVGGGEAE